MSNQSLGTMIRALRTERSMTQLDLARQMGVTDKAVSKWEAVHRRAAPPLGFLSAFLLLAEEAAEAVGDAAERADLEHAAEVAGDAAQVDAAKVETAVGDAALHAVDDLGEVALAELETGDALDCALGVGDELLELLGGVREGGGDLRNDCLNVYVLPFVVRRCSARLPL